MCSHSCTYFWSCLPRFCAKPALLSFKIRGLQKIIDLFTRDYTPDYLAIARAMEATVYDTEEEARSDFEILSI